MLSVSTRKPLHTLFLRAGVLAAVAYCSCATQPRVPAAHDNPLPNTSRVDKLMPGDTIDVKFVYWPDLDETQAIRTDGMVSLALVGDVQAAGLTSSELRSRLIELYKPHLKDPEITVITRTETSRPVYVGGEVLKPGAVPMMGRMTVMAAIMAAGGIQKRSAKLDTVLIIREMEGIQYARTIDLREAYKSAESESFYLEPYDIIFVPPTVIDRVNQWIEQYVNRVIPENIGTYDLQDLIKGENDSNQRNRTLGIRTGPLQATF